MRYFRRAGPDVLVMESESRHQFVEGPKPPSDEHPEGVPGGTIAYNDRDPREERLADQMAGDPYWYEVDGRGDVKTSEPETKPLIEDETETSGLAASPEVEKAEVPETEETA
jgi:hypothetical protein